MSVRPVEAHCWPSWRGVAKLWEMAETHFNDWIAQHYETLWPELYEPAAIDRPVAVLAKLAGAGPVLELGIGTGRIALRLSRRGIEVHGIELSAAMADRLKAESGGSEVAVTIGDFATTKLDKRFTLAYLVRSTITNLTSRRNRSSAPRTSPPIWKLADTS